MFSTQQNDDLRRRQEVLESDNRELWAMVHQTREDMARLDKHMEDLCEAVKDHRTETKRGFDQVEQTVDKLFDQVGTKMDSNGNTRIHALEEKFRVREGIWKTVNFTVKTIVPALAAVAGTWYYLTQVIG